MMFSETPTKVLLPAWVWEEAQNEVHFKKLVLQYMQPRYPYYKILKVKGHFAICERKN